MCQFIIIFIICFFLSGNRGAKVLLAPSMGRHQNVYLNNHWFKLWKSLRCFIDRCKSLQLLVIILLYCAFSPRAVSWKKPETSTKLCKWRWLVAVSAERIRGYDCTAHPVEKIDIDSNIYMRHCCCWLNFLHSYKQRVLALLLLFTITESGRQRLLVYVGCWYTGLKTTIRKWT